MSSKNIIARGAVLLALLLLPCYTAFGQSKELKKEIKKMTREGWVPAGEGSVSDQLMRLDNMRGEYLVTGQSKYDFANAVAGGKSLDEAKRKAMLMAKNELSAQMCSNVFSEDKACTENDMETYDSHSTTSTKARLKDIISVVQFYRQNNGQYEVYLTVALEKKQ